jgi:hypothetical protein
MTGGTQAAPEGNTVNMDYLVVRVDADHVLPAGYVHPSIQK